MTDVLGYRVVLSNPYLTKAVIPSKKETDTIDAVVLADLLRVGYIATRFVPCDKFTPKKKNLERRISAMISKKYSKENCIRFVKRLKREKMMLFTFLQTGTNYHNNTV